ncbi:MAG: PhaM family polyhydroxyalkanoate granule multifunctional regulatory protein [Ramlibacter sp.]
MSDNTNFGFGKFVPGFDFLQNLAKGASQTIPQMPNLANWVAPTLNVEELDKRLEELKAVHFWLDQNSKALGATIQALEVQKMTLATLKGMNFNMGDVANALKLKAADTVVTGVQKAAETAATAAGTVSGVAGAARRKATGKAVGKSASKADPAGMVDPLQWWGSLTQQFQQIAASAMKDAAKQTAMDTTKNMATGLAKEAFKAASGVATGVASGVKKAGAPKPAARKTTRRSR